LDVPSFYPPSDEKMLKELINSLWPSLLRNESNNAFWILGGDFSSESLGETSLLTAAFGGHDDKESNLPDDPYSTCRDMLSPIHLCNDEELHYFLTLWTEVENLIYAISRYPDNFKANLREFENNVHNIQGILFKIISTDKRYSKVWMQSQLCQKLFNNRESFLGKWLVKNNLHHHLRLGRHADDIISYDDLKEMFVKWQFIMANEIPLFDQIVMVIKMMGRRYHYEHQSKPLIEDLKKEQTISKKQLAEIKALLASCIEANKKYEKDSSEEYKSNRFCHFTRKSL
jgi:hypothetical protein